MSKVARPFSLAAASLKSEQAIPELLKQDSRCKKVVTLILNRPNKRNALSVGLLNTLLDELVQAHTEKKIVILKGSGKVFCSGHDLKEALYLNSKFDGFNKLAEVCFMLQRVPSVSVINSLCSAAGVQLAASCSLVVGTPASSFALPGISAGVFCTGPAVPLIGNVPRAVLNDMLLTGRTLSAEEAERFGILSRLVSEVDLDKTVEELCSQIGKHSRFLVEEGLAAVKRCHSLPSADRVAAGADEMTRAFREFHDVKEGIAAFVEKRPPSWAHC